MLKRKLLQYLTKNLLKAVNEDDVLRMTSEGWLLNNRKFAPEELSQLGDDARSFQQSFLWKLMRKDVEYTAFVRGRQALTDRDNDACHYMFYNLDILEKFLNNCAKL